MARVVQACWASWEATGPGGAVWRAYASPGTALSGVVRWYSEPDAVEVQGGVAARDAAYGSVVRQGRAVAVVQHSAGLTGGVVAVSQGDLRPGSGADLFSGLSQDDASAQVQDALDRTVSEAVRYAAAAADHAG